MIQLKGQWMPHAAATEINALEKGKAGWRSLGSGKITVDSGAGESVIPTEMFQSEPLYQTDKVGRTYIAAEGQALINK